MASETISPKIIEQESPREALWYGPHRLAYDLNRMKDLPACLPNREAGGERDGASTDRY